MFIYTVILLYGFGVDLPIFFVIIGGTFELYATYKFGRHIKKISNKKITDYSSPLNFYPMMIVYSKILLYIMSVFFIDGFKLNIILHIVLIIDNIFGLFYIIALVLGGQDEEKN